VDTIPKPDDLLALHGVTEELFETLQRWFAVPESVSLTLGDIDSAVEELGDPVMIAALAMRKLQALRLLATPGVRTSTDVVVSIVQDLNRALLQAPSMHLRRAAEQTDWDAAFQQLMSTDADADATTAAPTSADDEDAETVRFRALHDHLHKAVYAVLQASDGEIRYLV
jgi:transposase